MDARQTQLATLLITGVVLSGLTGCSSSASIETPETASEDSPVHIVDVNPPTQPNKDRMLAAKDDLFTKLSGRLMETMASLGPAAAITVCSTDAPMIANEVGQKHGLQIGRTGVRLRNIKNTSPQWAVKLTKAMTDTPTFVTLSNGHDAALLPIRLHSQCLMCHGPQEQIAPIVKDQLTKLYPSDQATGFKEGELRGWFWVDLPNE